LARTDINTLYLGLRYLLITAVLMFVAPFSIYQAFKNQEHPLYVPVLIFGIISAIAAISLGFLGVKTITDSFFNNNKD